MEFVRDHVVEFVEIWHPMISGLYSRHGVRTNIVDLEDMQQEAVLKVLSILPRFDPARTKGVNNYSKLTNFLITCVHRELVSMSFRNSFSIHIPSGSQRIVDQETQESARPACHDMSHVSAEDDRIDDYLTAREIIDTFDENGLLHMYYMDGMSQKQIAEKLGTTTSTISRRLTSIEDRIRKHAKEVE